MKRLTLLTVIFFTVFTVSISAASYEEIENAVNTVAENLYKTVAEPTISNVGGEWAVIGLSRSGCDIPTEYYNRYYENAEKYIKDKDGVLSENKYTEYARVILAMTAIGKNPSDISGYNLLAPLGDYDKTRFQGVNGIIWALIALDSGNYDEFYNESAQNHTSREKCVDELLSLQLTDGGWSLSGKGSGDIDITSMALQALSKYNDNAEVKQAVERALVFLSERQNENGGYTNSGTETSESTVQVLTALSELNISTDDERFVKNGKSLTDNLLSYYTGNGFKHIHESNEDNLMATEQAFYALVDCKRIMDGKTSLYDMSDAMVYNNKTDFGLSGKNADISYMPIIYNEKIFDDISGNIYENEIKALALRGIINGKSENLFEPQSNMTRAEFAAIVVRALGLPLSDEKIFDDVNAEDWFFKYTASAYKYGIVSGVSVSEFNPNGTITKEEAAVMTARAAKLCGINKNYDETTARNILSAFIDYTQADEWAKESLSFCYDNGILSDEEIDIRPFENITRAEISYMVYNMLEVADLLDGGERK